jgi:hypothetical protein
MSDAPRPDDLRDQLPDDLNAVEHFGPYEFPDNSRRRKPAILYTLVALVCLLLWLTQRDAALVNDGFLWAAILLGAVALFSFTSGWRMHVDEKEALVAAQGAVGFPVGHASAQQVWRGLRSRPTWRVLVFIVIPMMRGSFATAFVLLATSVVRLYDLSVSMTNGGPGISSEVPAKFVMDFLFERGNLGLATAAATTMLVTIIAVVAPWYYWQTRQTRGAAA